MNQGNPKLCFMGHFGPQSTSYKIIHYTSLRLGALVLPKEGCDIESNALRCTIRCFYFDLIEVSVAQSLERLLYECPVPKMLPEPLVFCFNAVLRRIWQDNHGIFFR
jgi:hypothetical protein